MGKLKDILTGAVSGATAGSALGPWGIVGGALAGGTAGAFAKSGKKDKGGGGGGIFGSKQDQTLQLSNLLPEQQNFLLNNIDMLQGGQVGQNYGLGQDYLQRMISGDPQEYERFAAPYRAQFQGETIPMLQEQFAAAGGPSGGGLGSSSGFASALGSAGGQFNANLAGLYANLRNQAANQAFTNYGGLSNMALGTRAFQPSFQPGQPGLGASIFGKSASGLADILTQQIGKSLSEKIAGFFDKSASSKKTTGIA